MKTELIFSAFGANGWKAYILTDSSGAWSSILTPLVGELRLIASGPFALHLCCVDTEK